MVTCFPLKYNRFLLFPLKVQNREVLSSPTAHLRHNAVEALQHFPHGDNQILEDSVAHKELGHRKNGSDVILLDLRLAPLHLHVDMFIK